MNFEDHAKNLGGLITNLNSLEFIIRLFLGKLPTAKAIDILPKGKDVYTLPVGSELSENELTNYDTLGELISKFNLVAKEKGFNEINKSIVEIRDAFAHGRVSSAEYPEQLRLIKFSKPRNGKVKITFNEILTEEWFKEKKKIVLDAIHLVYNVDKTMFPPSQLSGV